MAVEEEIDRLYGLPLEEFTAARDALAATLRRDKRRTEADEVKRMRKPNLVAWALNQVTHAHPGSVAALLEAGERLQEVQRALVSGGGEHGALREASAAQRRLAQEIIALAEGELAQAGHGSGPSLQTKLWSTVHAAAAGSEATELMRKGRLVRDYEFSDLGLEATGAVAEPAVTRTPGATPRTKDATRATRQDTDRERAQAQRRHRAISSQLERARARANDLEGRRKEAERASAQARRDVERAGAKLERAQANAADATDKALAAQQRVAELEQSLKDIHIGR